MSRIFGYSVHSTVAERQLTIVFCMKYHFFVTEVTRVLEV